MKTIIILGAGLSSSSLIKYLLDHSTEHHWKVIVGDLLKETAEKKINNHPNGKAIQFDSNDTKLLSSLVSGADVVISMLPAMMHPIVAKECVRQGKHMVTASYVSEAMKALDKEAKFKGIALLNELGVDPGIDHMSAMKIIDEIKSKEGKLLSFMSNTGGLVAPAYDNNPWNYKFTWNPKNVVLAGTGVAKYKEEGQIKYVPYHKLFERTINMSVLNYGDFEMYPNRDSLQYREIYGIEDIPTIIRGTFRRPGYCKAWNIFVQLGVTDDTYKVKGSEDMTYRDFINSFLSYDKNLPVESKLAKYCGIGESSETMQKLKWLGIFENKKVGVKDASPAMIIQKLLEEKWALGSKDKDLIVMQHQFVYELKGKKKRIKSSLIVEGQDTTHTAMSITVGTPIAIATKLLLAGKINVAGVCIPITENLYNPVLKELEAYGIKFTEEDE